MDAEAMDKPNLGAVQAAALNKDAAGVQVRVQEIGDNPPPQYMGSVSDKHDMLVLGRQQVLRRNYHFVSILGFSAVLICTWELLFANLIFALTDGGLAGIFWGFTITIIASVFIYLSIGEMASMSPTAGGQYHWVSEVNTLPSPLFELRVLAT